MQGGKGCWGSSGFDSVLAREGGCSLFFFDNRRKAKLLWELLSWQRFAGSVSQNRSGVGSQTPVLTARLSQVVGQPVC